MKKAVSSTKCHAITSSNKEKENEFGLRVGTPQLERLLVPQVLGNSP
jgi:hypothetical protein